MKQFSNSEMAVVGLHWQILQISFNYVDGCFFLYIDVYVESMNEWKNQTGDYGRWRIEVVVAADAASADRSLRK